MEIYCNVSYYQRSATPPQVEEPTIRSRIIVMFIAMIVSSTTLIATGEGTQASPFYAFRQSDTFGRCVVALLFLASIVAWTIMIDKWLMLKRTRNQCDEARRCFDARDVAEFLALCPAIGGVMGSVSGAVCAGLTELSGMSEEATESALSSGGLPVEISAKALRRLRSHAEAQVDTEVMEIEANLGFLSSIVSASPFLGLLGTVWGVMMAFSGMAMQGKADINAIAPGVSGALLTTVVGLLVAIPAVIGYNILVNEVKRLTVELDNFTEELLTKLDVADRSCEGDA